MERSVHLSPTRCRRTTLRRFNDGKLAKERLTSRRRTSSFTASSDGLSGVPPGEGCQHGMVDALDPNQGIDGRCDAAVVKLAEETYESASDVVVYGMVR